MRASDDHYHSENSIPWLKAFWMVSKQSLRFLYMSWYLLCLGTSFETPPTPEGRR